MQHHNEENNTGFVECALNTYGLNGACVPFRYCKGDTPCYRTTERYHTENHRIGACKLILTTDTSVCLIRIYM